jgi:hypothetical protein
MCGCWRVEAAFATLPTAISRKSIRNVAHDDLKLSQSIYDLGAPNAEIDRTVQIVDQKLNETRRTRSDQHGTALGVAFD